MVLVCGGLTLDWVRDHRRVHGPTPGGNALYAAVGAWLAGADVEMVSVVGADYPEGILRQLDDGGIGTRLLRRVDGPSFRVLLDVSGPERTISYRQGSGSNQELDPIPAQLAELTGDVAGAHVAAIPTSSQRAMVDALAGRAGVITLDTVIIPGQIEPSTAELLDVARRCSVFVPSREEVRRLWPDLDPLAALCDMASWAAPMNVITLGPDGSVGCHDGQVHTVAAAPARVVDTTGAGDSYCGALCTALARGDALDVAMAWGSAAAAVIIEHFGCRELLDERAREQARRYAEQVLHTTAFRRSA